MTSSYSVDIGDLHLNVLDWGGGANPPLFLLHGLASGSHMFDLVAPSLTHTHRVIAFDQRGHGMSDKPDDGYDFETIARDLDRLADALGFAQKPMTIVGHSWGAYTSLYYAATRPSRTAKAVLLDGGIRVLRDTFPTWAEGEIGLAPPEYRNMSADDIKAFIRRWQGEGYRPEIEPLALTLFDMHDPKQVHAHLSRANNMKIARALWEFAPTDYYANVQCPLLIVNAVAAGQSVTPDMARYVSLAEQGVRDCQVVWMHDTTHDIPWHRPQELSAVLNGFL
jgi:pimeloyl-ACP methyl ester carboxylesterase